MNFYYDSILGLVYSFSSDNIILDIGEIPKLDPIEILELFNSRGIIIKNSDIEDPIIYSKITSNLFDCDFDIIDYPVKKSSYDGVAVPKNFTADEAGHWGNPETIEEETLFWQIMHKEIDNKTAFPRNLKEKRLGWGYHTSRIAEIANDFYKA